MSITTSICTNDQDDCAPNSSINLAYITRSVSNTASIRLVECTHKSAVMDRRPDAVDLRRLLLAEIWQATDLQVLLEPFGLGRRPMHIVSSLFVMVSGRVSYVMHGTPFSRSQSCNTWPWLTDWPVAPAMRCAIVSRTASSGPPLAWVMGARPPYDVVTILCSPCTAMSSVLALERYG